MTKEVKIYGLLFRSVNKIKYIGITQNNLHTRRLEHIRRKKLNPNDVEIIQLAVSDTKERAAKIEAKLIQQYDTIVNGLNVSPYITNGNANAKSEEERARISAAMKGKAKPKSEVLARIGKKKRNNGFPPNVKRDRTGIRYVVQLVGVKAGLKSNYHFGTYDNIKDAETVAKAVAAYAVKHNQVLDGFSHPLWARRVRLPGELPKGVIKTKYNTYQVSYNIKFSGKNQTVGFGAYRTLEEASEVAAAAQSYIDETGSADGFRHPKVKVARFID